MEPPITQYRVVSATLHLNNRTYSTRLVKPDIKRPLLCADFLQQHNLLVDICGNRLIETGTYSTHQYCVQQPTHLFIS